MCGKKPRPPKPTAEQVAAEKEAALLREMEFQRQREIRAEAKGERLEMTIAKLGTKYGRTSLLTGNRGGQGYAAPMARSLLEVRS